MLSYLLDSHQIPQHPVQNFENQETKKIKTKPRKNTNLELWKQPPPSEADLQKKKHNSMSTRRNRHEKSKTEEMGMEIVQRIVVLPALSNPRTRIRASLFPKREENIFVNRMPILSQSMRDQKSNANRA